MTSFLVVYTTLAVVGSGLLGWFAYEQLAPKPKKKDTK